MRFSATILVFTLLIGCSISPAPEPRAEHDFTAEQNGSRAGPVSGWRLDPAVNAANLQAMRDRAYAFCAGRKRGDASCPADQDVSLLAYARAFNLIRVYREEAQPSSPYASGHKDAPRAFDAVLAYCSQVYSDADSSDARGLGPCMMAGVGGDFFSVVAVP